MSTPSSRPSTTDRGFTLLELLATLGIASILLLGAVQLTATQLRIGRQHTNRLEAHHALRSSLAAFGRDLRLAGACLPTDGEFIALAGVDDASGDAVTIRTGLIRDRTCLVTSFTRLAGSGTSAADVASSEGFEPGMLAYVRHLNGGGQILGIESVAAGRVTFDTPLVQDFPVASGLYGIDQRVYALDRSTPSEPILTLTVDDDPAMEYARDIRDLQIRYTLQRNCTPCDTVALPSSTAEWRLVNAVDVRATFEAKTSEGTALVEGDVSAKPRNLIP